MRVIMRLDVNYFTNLRDRADGSTPSFLPSPLDFSPHKRVILMFKTATLAVTGAAPSVVI